MRLRLFAFGCASIAALIIAAGCERRDSTPVTAEVDEPAYRRGHDLKRQGRNQEALSEFQKVVEARGLNNAPESHLELGILYEQHIKDPLAAIFHYKKFRELKPNSPQDESVKGRVDASIREFARSLPAAPLENRNEKSDLHDVLQRYQRENEQLKLELARARAAATSAAKARPEPAPDEPASPVRPGPSQTAPSAAGVVENSPVSRTPAEPEPAPGPAPAQPTAPPPSPAPSPGPRRPANPPPTVAQPGAKTGPNVPATGRVRVHQVAKGETLYRIAEKYYGSGGLTQKVDQILAANRDVLRTAAELKPGMVLRIP